MRRVAAEALLRLWTERAEIDKYRDELSALEDVLDILEDVGFYIEAEQISAEVAHNHLYHWIRLWWFAGRPFVEAHQKREPPRWDHVALLYYETSVVEKRRMPKQRKAEVDAVLDDVTLNRFLLEECDLVIDRAEPTKATAP
ncbi:MAG: hypothetical protein JWM87_1368 [Candidatus Eremiobacteraeota bacterium]|nr:hypothetical protein [Candidatus Eremiobacteraeota bacterium]